MTVDFCTTVELDSSTASVTGPSDVSLGIDWSDGLRRRVRAVRLPVVPGTLFVSESRSTICVVAAFLRPCRIPAMWVSLVCDGRARFGFILLLTPESDDRRRSEPAAGNHGIFDLAGRRDGGSTGGAFGDAMAAVFPAHRRATALPHASSNEHPSAASANALAGALDAFARSRPTASRSGSVAAARQAPCRAHLQRLRHCGPHLTRVRDDR